MSGVMNRSNFKELMTPNLRKAFFLTYDEEGTVMPKYWDEQDSYKASETIVEIVVPSEVPVAAEGGVYSRSELRMGRSKTYVHATYELDVIMTRELQEDNLYPTALKTQKALAIAMARTIDRIAAKTYSNGLSSETTPDTKAVFAPDHPVLYATGTNPSSWSNVLPATPFGSRGIKALKTLMKKQRDENGDLVMNRMKQLLVPTDLEEEALEMIGSPGTYDRTDRAKNQAGEGLSILAVPHFEDADHAFAATAYFGRDPQKSENIWFWRIRPDYELVHDVTTGNIIQRVRARWSCGFQNPRGHVAAYS